MAVTRSIRKMVTPPPTAEVTAGDKLSQKIVKKVEKSPHKVRKSPQKKTRIYFEDSISHIKTPTNLVLPQSFVDFHEPQFVEGVEYTIRKDPSLYPVIVHSNFPSFQRLEEQTTADKKDIILKYWYSLIRSVISQQISGAAAKSIEAKFCSLFGDRNPNPEDALQKTHEELRGSGLSNQKINYVRHISETFSDSGSQLTDLSFYAESDVETIIEELVKLKGIGPWTAKMFIVFTLKKLDVFAHDDLGIAKGLARYLDRRQDIWNRVKLEVKGDEKKLVLLKKRSTFDNPKSKNRDWVPLHDEYVKHVAQKFSPYRSVFMLILWRLASTNVAVLETID